MPERWRSAPTPDERPGGFRSAAHVAGRGAHLPRLAAHRPRRARHRARRRPAAAGADRRRRTSASACSAPATVCSASSCSSAGRVPRRSACAPRWPRRRPLPADSGRSGCSPSASLVLAVATIVADRRRGLKREDRVSHYAPSRELVVDVCRTLLDRGYLKATEGNVSVRVPGEDAFAITPSSYDYGKMRSRGHLRPRARRAADPRGRQEGVDRGAHARGRLRAAPGRERHHPHAPAVRERAGADASGRSPPCSTSRCASSAARSRSSTTPRRARLPQEERGEEARQRRQRLHPRQPRRAGARRRPRAGRVQHGAAREGRPRLPAGADHRGRARCRCPSARSPSPSCARTRRSSPRRSRRRAPRARRPEAAARRKRGCGGGAGGRRRAAARRRPRRRRRRRRPRRPAPPAPSSPATRSARYPDVDDVYAAAATPSSPSRCARSGTTPWTATSTTSRPSAAAARSSPTRRVELIPGGVQHNLAFNYPFPLAIERAEGAHLWDVDGNAYIDFLQAGGPTVLGSNYAPVREKVAEVVAAVRPGHRPLPRVRAQAGRARPPAHAGLRDVPHARLRHRERDGRRPRRARVHRQEVGDQGRRRLPRLERPDGLRAARARHLADRGQGHPVRRHGAHARGLPQRPRTRCAASSCRTGRWAARRP